MLLLMIMDQVFQLLGITKCLDRFYTERPIDEEFGKTLPGLGLSISKQIIEAHNAEIKVENIFDPKKQVNEREL